MRAPSLGHTALFAALLALSTCLRGYDECPRSLDCARWGRHFCPPGGSQCGSCLRPLVENSRGHCVVKRRRPVHPALHLNPAHPLHSSQGEVRTAPELDQEIDFLSAIISEQRTESRLPVSDEPVLQAHRAPPTEQSGTNQSAPNTSVAPPTTAASTNHTAALLSGPVIVPYPTNEHVFIVLSSVFIVVGSLALVVAGACWVRLQRGVRLSQKVDYPAYGLMRAHTFNPTPADNKLAHSAQMFHYQHQKQQMLSMEKQSRDEQAKVSECGASTDEENEDGDFTVYECPGLAPTGEMEVKNPLFDDSTLYLQKFYK